MDRFAEKYYSMPPYQYGGLAPIKHIDVNGDSIWITSSAPVRNGNDIIQNHTINITGKVLKSATSYTSASKLAGTLNGRLNSQKGFTSAKNALGGESIDNYHISASFTGAQSMGEVGKSDHLVVMVDQIFGKAGPKLGGGPANGVAKIGGLVSYVKTGGIKEMVEIAFHEIGHSMGLTHPDANNKNDPMSYTGQGASFSGDQLREITGNPVNIGPNHTFILNRTPKTRHISTNEVPYIGPRGYMMKVPRPITINQ